MNGQSFISGTKMGTIGGTLTILFVNISNSDILKTIVMATIGAVVSFIVSQVLKWLMRPPKSP